MKVIRTIEDIRKELGALRMRKKRIGFVPTMGALHVGHASLIRQARKECDIAVVSIFVNPAQFGPKEDYARYPRTMRSDVRLCSSQGVDFIFNPGVKEMYSAHHQTYVEVEKLGKHLCGKSRPGHFRGVTTVVAKLFNIVQPDVAYFGQKDAQQAYIIRRMAHDLNMPVTIKVLPTVREQDGLAVSSRNRYLSAHERAKAVVLSEALALAGKLIRGGQKDVQEIIRAMEAHIKMSARAAIEYIALVDLEHLQPQERLRKRADFLVALAVKFGKTRLIDNMIFRGNAARLRRVNSRI